MIEQAYKIIYKAFYGKTDKAGQPYVLHLDRVAQQFRYDEELFCIALLHDLIEDCPEWDLDSLKAYFPFRVISAVDALTKVHGETYDNYLLRVATNRDAILVKISDLQDNLNVSRLTSTLTVHDFSRIKKYHSAYLALCAFIRRPVI